MVISFASFAFPDVSHAIISAEFPKTTLIASTKSGDITITFTASGLTSVQKFTWTKNVQAYNGTNAFLFQLMAPQGDVILKNLDGNVNTVLLKTQLLNGTTVVTSGISYVWKKYTNGARDYTISAVTVRVEAVCPGIVV